MVALERSFQPQSYHKLRGNYYVYCRLGIFHIQYGDHADVSRRILRGSADGKANIPKVQNSKWTLRTDR